MNKREFNKHLNACSTKKRLDTDKIKALPEGVRESMVKILVRYRAPIVVECLTPSTDMDWLASCGYLYRTTGKESGYTFLHTIEHSIK